MRCTMNALPFTCQGHLLAIGHLNLTKEFTLLPLFQIAHQTIPLHTPLLGEVQLVIVRHGRFEAEHLYECTKHTIVR